MAVLCLDASLEMLQPLCCRCTLRLQGISATAFTRDLLRLSRLLWHFCYAISSKTAHSLLSKGLRSALPESQFSALSKAIRFLHNHSWVVLAFWAGTEFYWKTHSWPLKGVMLRCFTTPCSTSSWYTRTPVAPLSCKNEDVPPRDGTPPTKPWCRKGDGLPGPLERFPSPQGTFDHKSCCSGSCTAPRWWRFSRLWRGCFRAHSQRATGDTPLLSIESPSKQE